MKEPDRKFRTPRFPSKYDGGSTVSSETMRKILEVKPKGSLVDSGSIYSLTPEEKREWEALPPATAEEMERIRNETPEESEREAERIIDEILEESRSLRQRMRRAGKSMRN